MKPLWICTVLASLAALPVGVLADERTERAENTAEVESACEVELKIPETSSEAEKSEMDITYTFVDPQTLKEITFDENSLKRDDGVFRLLTEDGQQITVVEKFQADGQQGMFVCSEEGEITYFIDE